ncbi:hypothetical protein MCHI_000473 [Candidatus Magnetoovum chiemensis]|nr:hypothetical protein MCHI_000473 [Candidatus Magnetoovum chiemensis]
MEVGFKYIDLAHELFPDYSFNPCFNGSWVQIITIIRMEAKNNNVSILVLMEVGFKCSKEGSEGCYNI